MNTAEKLEILTDAAKYDVACTSSGVDRAAQVGRLGSTYAAGICHSFSADGRCITLLKVLMTNACIHDCAYCANRRSNDIRRAAFEPRELADLVIEFYRRNYIEGLFLSSGVVRNPDFTMEYLIEPVRILREEYGFLGYIHVKAIPGASRELVDKMGYLVDRMSVNIELPSRDSLRILAPGKSKESILSPMAAVADGIRERPKGKPRHRRQLPEVSSSEQPGDVSACGLERSERTEIARLEYAERFVPAGQSTQLIVGATPESDFQILRLSSSLYEKYALKRVFFSAYLPINDEAILPGKGFETPLAREHRLYQADWLMRFYQFSAEELVDSANPFLDIRLDPKASWALRHLDQFPIELNTAPYELLLRVPGLGVKGARRVLRARRHQSITPEALKRMGLTYKKMRYFVTCGGKSDSPLPIDADAIRTALLRDSSPAKRQRRSGGRNEAAGQLSLFNPADLSGDAPIDSIGEDLYGSSSVPFQASQLQAFANQRALLEETAS